MNSVNKFWLSLILCLIPVAALAQGREEVKIPDDVKPFVEKGMKPIALKKADLNSDGTEDYVMVLTNAEVKPDEVQNDDSHRPTLVIVRGADGKLSLAARNDLAAFCAGCGGVMGDPFQDVEVKKGSFTLTNSGGSRERWSSTYQFNYSRRDNTWQLVRAEESSFDTMRKEKSTNQILVPPKNYGKINFADFDPDSYKGKGAK